MSSWADATYAHQALSSLQAFVQGVSSPRNALPLPPSLDHFLPSLQILVCVVFLVASPNLPPPSPGRTNGSAPWFWQHFAWTLVTAHQPMSC